MGVQGNYPGSGAYPKHYNQAVGKSVTGSKNVDSHLHEGPASDGGSLVHDPHMKEGSGAHGDVGIVHEDISFPSGPGNVGSNIP